MLHLALTVILSKNNSSMVPFIAHGLNEIVIRIEFGNVRDFVQTTWKRGTWCELECVKTRQLSRGFLPRVQTQVPYTYIVDEFLHGEERHDALRLKFHMAFDMEFQSHGIHPFLDEFFDCGHPETCYECTERISDIKWTLHARSEEFFKSQFLKLGPAKFGIFIFQFATKSLVISYFCSSKNEDVEELT